MEAAKTALDYTVAQVYLRDGFVPFSEANVSIASSSVLYGLSIYTVFSASWNAEANQLYYFRLPEHYTRLVNSARIMGFADFSAAYSQQQFDELALDLLRRNQVKEDVLVRTTIFIDELIAGTRIDGLKNSLSMYVYPMGEILSRKGIHACVSTWAKVADNMIPARAKVNGSYVNNSLMKNEALLNGFDEAIALDAAGHVTEATVANLFLVRDGRLVTPATSGDILEGITRNSVLTLAADLGITCEERPVDRSELYLAEEIFMVGSSARVTPVLSVDRRPVGSGQAGVTTQRLTKAYAEAQIDHAGKYGHWLTPVH
jgi:branched-chain amino acid aminotransferase